MSKIVASCVNVNTMLCSSPHTWKLYFCENQKKPTHGHHAIAASVQEARLHFLGPGGIRRLHLIPLTKYFVELS